MTAFRVVLIALAALACSAPAASAAPGSISGTVTQQGGPPVGSFQVDAYTPSGVAPSATTCTANDGTYTLSGLEPGQYVVGFLGKKGPCGDQSVFAPKWSGGSGVRTFADEVTVADGATTQNVDAQLILGAKVTGIVKAAADQSPVASVTLDLLDTSGAVLRSECSGGDGKYTFIGLGGGVYSLRIDPRGSCGNAGEFARQWYDGADTPERAKAINLGNGEEATLSDVLLGPIVPASVEIQFGGLGNGTVTSANGDINCPGDCRAEAPEGTEITLTASPASNSTFKNWAGAGCAGAAATCTFAMAGARNLLATFDLKPGATPTPSATPTPVATTPPGGATPSPTPSSGTGTAAPKCTLSAKRVLKKKITQKLSLTYRCDQAAKVTLAGTITEKAAKKGARAKTYKLRGRTANAVAGRSATVSLTLPRAAQSALRKKRSQSAALTLTARNANGTGKATARVARLR